MKITLNNFMGTKKGHVVRIESKIIITSAQTRFSKGSAVRFLQ